MKFRKSSEKQRKPSTECRAKKIFINEKILDEATSSVDTRTEVEISNAPKKLMRGRTSFVTAHRLSAIRNADIILFMENGNIIEPGNHKEPLAQGGAYSALYYSRFA